MVKELAVQALHLGSQANADISVQRAPGELSAITPSAFDLDQAVWAIYGAFSGLL